MNHQAHQASYDAHQESLVDFTAKQVVDGVFRVHKTLGPGLLESAYERCLISVLQNKGLKVEYQKELPIIFEGQVIDKAYRVDLLINDHLIVESKAIEKILPIHEAQLLTYLKLSKIKIGLLVNFNTKQIKDGIRRYAL